MPTSGAHYSAFCLYGFACLGLRREWNHITYAPLCLASLSIMLFRSIHVVACVSTSFLFMAELYSSMWTEEFYLSIHPLLDGHLGRFHLLAIVSNAVVNICIELHGFFNHT